MKVSELLDKVLPRVADLQQSSGMTFLEAVNKVADIFFNRLHQLRSSIAREQWSGTEISREFLYLPSDFRGFADKQWLEDTSSNRYSLEETPLEYQGAEGTEPPPYFDFVGPFKLRFTPPPSDDSGEYDDVFTLNGFYYSHPGDLKMVNYLPWEDLYDHEFEEGVLIALGLGTTDSMVVQRIGDLVTQQVSNRVVAPRRNKAWP